MIKMNYDQEKTESTQRKLIRETLKLRDYQELKMNQALYFESLVERSFACFRVHQS